MSQVSELGLLGRLKFLAKDTFLYGIANSLSKLISVIVFPLLTRYFSVEAFGKIDILFAMANLLVALIVFGQDSAVARFYYEYDKDDVKQREIVSLSLFIQIVVLLIMMPILWYNAGFLAFKFTGNYSDNNLIKIIILTLPFGVSINYSANILKWTFKRKEFMMVTMGSSVTYLILVVISVSLFNPNIIDIFYLFIISRIIFSVVGLSFIKNYIIKVKNFQLVKSLLKYASPYGLICVIMAAIPSLDRYFIANSLNTYYLGIYAVGYKVANLLNFPISAFQTAWGPFYLSIFKDENNKETFNNILIIFSSVILTLTTVLALFSDYIIKVFASSKYIEAQPIILPLLLSIAVTSIKDVTTIGIDLSMKTVYRIYAMTIRLFTTLVCIYLFIDPLGILGVALALLMGSLAHFIFEVYQSQKIYSLKFSFKGSLVIFMATVIAGVSGNWIMDYDFYISITVRMLILMMFFTLIYKVSPQDLLIIFTNKIKHNWAKK